MKVLIKSARKVLEPFSFLASERWSGPCFLIGPITFGCLRRIGEPPQQRPQPWFCHHFIYFSKSEKGQIIVYTYYIFPCFAIWSNFQSSSTIHCTNIRATQYPNSQISVTARSLQNPKNLNNCTQEIVVEPLNAQRNILTRIPPRKPGTRNTNI